MQDSEPRLTVLVQCCDAGQYDGVKMRPTVKIIRSYSFYPIQSLGEDFNDHAAAGNPSVLVTLLQPDDAIQRNHYVLLRMRFGPLETQVTTMNTKTVISFTVIQLYDDNQIKYT